MKRLFVISNRLPVSVVHSDGKPVLQPASGGLVSAIESYLESNNRESFEKVYWCGVSGCNEAEWNELNSDAPADGFSYLPVFTEKKLYDQYYFGFSNSTIWPLFHYFTSFVEYNAGHYNSYSTVNLAFADSLLKHVKPGDVVWIHDYHLMHLASYLREKQPELTIGFFLHIPFPSYEIFRLLPRQWQADILGGLLSADLVGFHTEDYAAHFLESVQKVLGYTNDRKVICYADRFVKTGVFPISIDFEKFNQAFENKTVSELREKLHTSFPGKRIIFSVDRLDYTKGVSHRLAGYKLFLQQHPEYLEKIVFILVVVPSREFIPKYAERKKMIDELISDINSKTGTINWQPVIYQYNSLDFEQMLALYTACDLALITPIRDGMNLVAKEFVASRKDQHGVLLLSEMAGAAKELTAAIQVNPNDTQEIANKIYEGLVMTSTEQQERMAHMQNILAGYTVSNWAVDFNTQLQMIKSRQRRPASPEYLRLDMNHLPGVRPAELTDSRVPGDAGYSGKKGLPDPRRLNQHELLHERRNAAAEAWFTHLPLKFVSDHALKFRRIGNEWKTLANTPSHWKESIQWLLQQYGNDPVNSFLEDLARRVTAIRLRQPEQHGDEVAGLTGE
ncbi:MAG TPA: trehalose-6-phosphate synthase [Chitinophagaceae bacterium]